MKAVPAHERCPGPSYQDILESDRVRGPDGRPPAVLAPQPAPDLPLDDIPFERYTSEGFFEAEMARLWPRVWQFACRTEQVPEVGDYFVYDIGRRSIIVLRTESGLKAYHNSCLHRGTKLKPSGSAGWTSDCIQCPFHGWTWNLDGTLREVPCAWEFEHLDYSANRLPEARVEVWNSLVFVNMDANAVPLAEYLEVLPDHFRNWWSFDEWYTKVHVQKELSCNWKTAQEAFMEAYHTPVVHPEMTQVVGDWNMQHDVFGPHTSRDLCPMAVSSPSADHGLTEQELLDRRLGGPQAHTGEAVPEGERARAVVAERMRADMQRRYGKDLSGLSDAEVIDSLKYNVFPNLFVYGGPGLAQLQVVRPLGTDAHRCLLEFYMLQPIPPGKRPQPAEPVRITEADSYCDVPGIDAYGGMVLDQDTQILRWQHEGMLASRKGAETLSGYQESRIRHFHATLARYVEG